MRKPTSDPKPTETQPTDPKTEQPNKPKPNWYQIKECYLRGEGTLKELSERFEISKETVAQRATREKWVIDKRATYRFLVVKTSEQLAETALDWRKEIVHRGKIAMAFLDQIQEEYRSGARPLSESGLLMLSRCAESIDGLVRRSLGIPDKIEVKATEQDFHLIYLTQVKALKQIVAERKALGEKTDRSDRMLDVDSEEIE